MDPLPKFYHHFFLTLEPLLTILGSISAVIDPTSFFVDMVPGKVAAATATACSTPARDMAVRQLGSCYFLIALIASVFLRRIISLTPTLTQSQLEQVISSYLLCLALADLTHIGFTLYDLPEPSNVANWNKLVWGNVGITTALFVVRSAWAAGVGRQTRKANSKEAAKTNAKSSKTK